MKPKKRRYSFPKKRRLDQKKKQVDRKKNGLPKNFTEQNLLNIQKRYAIELILEKMKPENR